MNRTIKWTRTQTGRYTSEDSTITVCEDGASWVMEDSIEGESEVYTTKDEALDAGASRLMITQMGNFYVFLPALVKTDSVVFTHQIVG